MLDTHYKIERDRTALGTLTVIDLTYRISKIVSNEIIPSNITEENDMFGLIDCELKRSLEKELTKDVLVNMIPKYHSNSYPMPTFYGRQLVPSKYVDDETIFVSYRTLEAFIQNAPIPKGYPDYSVARDLSASR